MRNVKDLMEKIQALAAERIAEIDDFVEFVARARAEAIVHPRRNADQQRCICRRLA